MTGSYNGIQTMNGATTKFRRWLELQRNSDDDWELQRNSGALTACKSILGNFNGTESLLAGRMAVVCLVFVC
jgi:hypothetical protein